MSAIILDKHNNIAPKNKANTVISGLLMLLMVFFAFHNTQIKAYAYQAETKARISSIESPAPIKPPALEANHAVKFISRFQGDLKAPKPDEDKANTHAPVSELSGRSFLPGHKAPCVCIAYNPEYTAHRVAGAAYPRAPPVALT